MWKFIFFLMATLSSWLILYAAPSRAGDTLRTLEGTVTYHARIALPADAYAIVEARGKDGKVLAETKIPSQGRQPPFPYTLRIPTSIEATLRAGILVGEQPRWASEPVEIAAGSGPDAAIEIVVKPFQPMGFASQLRCGETVVTVGAAGQNAVLEVAGERFELAPVQSTSGTRFEAPSDPGTFFRPTGGTSRVSVRGKMLPECADVKTSADNRTNGPSGSEKTATDGASAGKVNSEQPVPASIGKLPASYEGELSCPGCENIRYHLDLFPDHRYVLRAAYAGTQHPTDTVGSWLINAEGTQLILPGGRRGTLIFAIEETATLRWLKQNGVGFASVLKRAATFQPVEPQPALATGALEDTYWKLTQLGDAPVTPEQKLSKSNLILKSLDRSVTGNAGCNRMIGHYILDDTKLEFGQIASTRMACTAGMDIEQRFLAALERVKTWRLDGPQLELLDVDGKRVARFETRVVKPILHGRDAAAESGDPQERRKNPGRLSR